MTKAIRILQAEHANMSKVLAVLEAEMRAFRELGKLDFDLMFTIIDYIESFPVKSHHPKEERYLFDALARRDPGAAPLIAELCRQHEDEKALIADLKAAVEALSIETPMDKAEFEKLVTGYSSFIYEHMRKEETMLFPMARESLRAEDWIEIEQAFEANRDPAFGDEAEERYHELLRRIIYLSQSPLSAHSDP
ncbi:MAG: hemerythrin domain-containing protein [Alphaproteobacteria bacterium]